MIPKRVLITGASGMIGAELTSRLLQMGYEVVHLGREKRQGKVKSFVWNVDEDFMEEGALDGVHAIIHLAGAGIADKPWTAKRKQEIFESRTKSTSLLFNQLKNSKHQVGSFIAASAIGYYGAGGSDEVFSEESNPGSGYMAEVVKAWESEVDKIQELTIRTVKIRVGIVLSGRGGALKEIAKPIRWGVGAPLGTGDQFMSWIHIDDLCRMFIYVLEQSHLTGAYNGVGPVWATNKELTMAAAKVLKRPLWLPPIPGLVLKIMLGEMADLVLLGSKVSSEKIQKAGFVFKFPDLKTALEDLLGSQQK